MFFYTTFTSLSSIHLSNHPPTNLDSLLATFHMFACLPAGSGVASTSSLQVTVEAVQNRDRLRCQQCTEHPAGASCFLTS
eukprot:scaffold399343_cov39-Prasinocladus_malaysianus.AAC.1